MNFSRRPGERFNRGRVPVSGGAASTALESLLTVADQFAFLLIGDHDIATNDQGGGLITVASWADQSGNGRDFVQATEAEQPRYNASDANANGRPGVLANIVDNSLNCATTLVCEYFFVIAWYPDATFDGFDGLLELDGGGSGADLPFRGENTTANWRIANDPVTTTRYRDGTATNVAIVGGGDVHLYEVTRLTGVGEWNAGSSINLGRDPQGTGREWRGGILAVGALVTAPTIGSGLSATLRAAAQEHWGAP